MKLDKLNNFRDYVNDDYYIMHVYKHVQQHDEVKNQWNIICSAMDWIETVVPQIDIHSIDQSNTSEGSISFLSFIMCVDVLCEAVTQLNRVLCGKKNLFKGVIDCFTINREKYTVKSDNEYFKLIRAVFAAHPTNLKSFNGGKDRYYASWSSVGLKSGEAFVTLYSNNPNISAHFFTVDINEILVYAEKYYSYLDVILELTEKEKKKYFKQLQKQPIALTGDARRDIKILLKELDSRMYCDYYYYELIRMDNIFKISIHDSANKSLVLSYKKWLKENVISAIKEGLQTLDMREFPKVRTNSEMFNTHNGYYMFHKAYEAIDKIGYLDSIYPFSDFVKAFKKEFGEMASFDNVESYEELYCIGLGCLLQRQSKQ